MANARRRKKRARRLLATGRPTPIKGDLNLDAQGDIIFPSDIYFSDIDTRSSGTVAIASRILPTTNGFIGGTGAVFGHESPTSWYTQGGRATVTIDDPQTPIQIIGGGTRFVPTNPHRNVNIDMNMDDLIGTQFITEGASSTASIINCHINQELNGLHASGALHAGDNITITSGGFGGTTTASVTGEGITWHSVSATENGFTFGYTQQPSAAEMIKQAAKSHMRSNLLIKTGRTRSIERRLNPAEIKARKTLRDHITERAYRRYLTNGFVMIKGASGLHYQIFANRGHTVIYNKNQRVGEICINTDYACPPTDHVINIKMLIELDEVSIWHGGNLKQFHKDFQIPFQLSKLPQSYRSVSPIIPKTETRILSLVEAHRKAKETHKAA